jgi:hypothetical protein
MEAVCSSETLVYNQKTTRRKNPKTTTCTRSYTKIERSRAKGWANTSYSHLKIPEYDDREQGDSKKFNVSLI